MSSSSLASAFFAASTLTFAIARSSELEALFVDCPVALRALKKQLVIADWTMVTSDVRAMFEEAASNTEGAVADYIPSLAAVNPDQWGVAVCSIDGQQFAEGDSDTRFCVQSCSKPISYGIAMELVGEPPQRAPVSLPPARRPA